MSPDKGLNRDKLYQKNRLVLKNSTDTHFCHMCGKQIPMDVKWPHPLSWSCQHIIPRSRGGSSDMDNLASAHKRCQDREGNALAGTSGDMGTGLTPTVRLRQSRVWH